MRIATVIMLRQREVNWREKGGIEYLMLKLHVNQLWSQV